MVEPGVEERARGTVGVSCFAFTLSEIIAQALAGASHSTAPADIIQDPLTEDECCPRLFVIDHHHLYPPCTLSPTSSAEAPQSASKILSFSRKAPLYPLNQQTTRLS